jgi:release factor glutamine methyltransferase
MTKTVGEVIKLSCEYIRSKGSSHGRREVEECIASTQGYKRLDLYLNFDKPLEENELVTIRKRIARLALEEPLQYIEGHVHFYGCKIAVDPRVLIPRPETELLVDLIVRSLKGIDLTNKVLWDICTGSGCIGIALKKALPDLTVCLSDISEEALKCAHENALANEVRVTCHLGDLFGPFKGKRADIIVCNPPYVTEAEHETLEAPVKNFEPKLALVSGKSGLECYERIAKEAHHFMNHGARAFLELGAGQAERVSSLLSSYTNVKTTKDLSGIDRFIEFQYP